MLYFVTGIVFLPGWVALARRIGKKRAWLLSIAINTGAFVGVFFLGPGDALIYGVLVFFSGIGLGATLALPSSIQADVIDYDELLTGERREGRYIGLWSIAKKLAAAVGVGAGLSILGLAGYIPNAEQPEAVLLALRVFMRWYPRYATWSPWRSPLPIPFRKLRISAFSRRSSVAKRGIP